MAAFYELKRSFAFSDTAFACKQNTDPVDIQQNSMAEDMRRKTAVKIMYGGHSKTARDSRGAKNENLMLLSKLKKLRRGSQVPADYNARDSV